MFDLSIKELKPIQAEVVGFKDTKVLMPLGKWKDGPEAKCCNGETFSVCVGRVAWAYS